MTEIVKPLKRDYGIEFARADLQEIQDKLLYTDQAWAAVAIYNTVQKNMFRVQRTRKTKPKSDPVTDDLIRRVKLIKHLNPGLSAQEIAGVSGVNQARVSDILGGFYG